MHALDPIALDGGDQRGMRVQGPVAADAVLQAERLGVRRQQQLDGRSAVADAMIQRGDAVAFVDSADHHHSHEHLLLADMARIARKQRLEREGLIGGDDQVDPGAWNVDTRQLGHHLVHLRQHDAVPERGRLDQCGGVLGVGAGVEISRRVGLFGAHQRQPRRQVHQHARVQLHVGADRADLELALCEQLRHAQALRSCEAEIRAARDAALEQRQVLGTADARNQQVQVVHLRRIDLHERAREKVGLFLIVAFKRYAVARTQQRLQHLHDGRRPHVLALDVRGDRCEPAGLVLAAQRPGLAAPRVGVRCCHEPQTLA